MPPGWHLGRPNGKNMQKTEALEYQLISYTMAFATRCLWGKCSGSALQTNTLDPPLMGGRTKVLTPHTWQRKHPCHIHTIPASWQLRTTSKSLKVVQQQQSTAIWATLTTTGYWKLCGLQFHLSQASPHGHVWPSTCEMTCPTGAWEKSTAALMVSRTCVLATDILGRSGTSPLAFLEAEVLTRHCSEGVCLITIIIRHCCNHCYHYQIYSACTECI